jgi:hypothetical protein
MTETSADLVVLLLRRSGLRAFVPRLLRPLSSGALLLIKYLPTSLLRILPSLLALLAALLLPGPLLALLLAALLGTPLFVRLTLGFRILCGLVLLVLIGQCGLLWLREPGGAIAARNDYHVTLETKATTPVRRIAQLRSHVIRIARESV